MTPDQALSNLIAGNDRYVTGQSVQWPKGELRRRELAYRQQPWACVLTCADSRVVPEIIFDCHLGDLFVIRIAGTICTAEVVESVEFAVSNFSVAIVLILAHSNCGAVAAAASDTSFDSRIVSALRPIVEQMRPSHPDRDELLSAASRENARRVRTLMLDSSPVLREKAASGMLKVITGYSDIGSGVVTFEPSV